MSTVARPSSVFERVAAAAVRQVRADRPLRRNLPGGGRLHLDRGLPLLAVYREPPGGLDEGTAELATALPAYLLGTGDPRMQEGLREVVNALARAARSRHGAFLLVEVWARVDDTPAGAAPAVSVASAASSHSATADRLASALRSVGVVAENGGDLGVPERLLPVDLRATETAAAPGLPALLRPSASGLFWIGLEVSPFYRDPASGAPFPRVVQALRRALARAIEEAAFVFAQEETSLDPPHPRALGRSSVERAAVLVDRRLGEVDGAFDTLLQVTPVNSEEAWESFRAGSFRTPPVFRYRPLSFDPEHLKRRLFHVPIERVEEPLLGYLFREKQEEMDREISLLRDLGTRRFPHASAELHGVPDDDLVALAGEVLRRLPPPRVVGQKEEYGEKEDEEAERGRFVDAKTFARLAREEIGRYRQQLPDFDATVEIRPGVAAGVMVSKGILCVSEHLRLPRERVAALLQHEVGTHLVTWCNGVAQPLRIFASGLAGYGVLQEGIAVLSEHLVGGLTIGRMRVLAGRVVAVRSVASGADFIETFGLLHRDHGFERRTAFIVALRVHRGGGLTKDAAYLAGLRDLLRHLRGGGSLDSLLVGKVGQGHAEVLQELVLTGVLRLPVVRPFYVSDLAAMERLGACRRMDVLDLVEEIRAQGGGGDGANVPAGSRR